MPVSLSKEASGGTAAYRHRDRHCCCLSSRDIGKKVQSCHQGGVGGSVRDFLRASSKGSNVIYAR